MNHFNQGTNLRAVDSVSRCHDKLSLLQVGRNLA